MAIFMGSPSHMPVGMGINEIIVNSAAVDNDDDVDDNSNDSDKFGND
jgi:hypothetical protein